MQKENMPADSRRLTWPGLPLTTGGAGLFNRFSPPGRLALSLLVMIFLAGIFADVLTAHPPDLPSGTPLSAPDSSHWLGTDDLGIDLWAQICHGARISLAVGFGTALLAGIGGTLAGLCAGYCGGRTDRILMRIADGIMVIPHFPFMIILGTFFGPSLNHIILVLALLTWTAPARLARAKIRAVCEEKYIIAAKSYGAGFRHLLLRHFPPHILPIAMVSFIRLVGRAAVAEAGLSFLGLGDPTAKSWGLILNNALNFSGIYFTDYWQWWIVSPLAALVLVAAGTAFVGRDLEQILNTKL